MQVFQDGSIMSCDKWKTTIIDGKLNYILYKQLMEEIVPLNAIYGFFGISVARMIR